ncbi:hypothetical protein V5799_026005 [Amblyomma americanum]|uniref:Uncharacterized protein n=1 Tax=Amblyomma americanum TaxID=6943 RepID=A0AAQ4DJT8_AMBAM
MAEVTAGRRFYSTEMRTIGYAFESRETWLHCLSANTSLPDCTLSWGERNTKNQSDRLWWLIVFAALIACGRFYGLPWTGFIHATARRGLRVSAQAAKTKRTLHDHFCAEKRSRQRFSTNHLRNSRSYVRRQPN